MVLVYTVYYCTRMNNILIVHAEGTSLNYIVEGMDLLSTPICNWFLSEIQKLNEEKMETETWTVEDEAHGSLFKYKELISMLFLSYFNRPISII